jgi:hypothetical protein
MEDLVDLGSGEAARRESPAQAWGGHVVGEGTEEDRHEPEAHEDVPVQGGVKGGVTGGVNGGVKGGVN